MIDTGSLARTIRVSRFSVDLRANSVDLRVSGSSPWPFPLYDSQSEEER